jgi:hypothetical protein
LLAHLRGSRPASRRTQRGGRFRREIGDAFVEHPVPAFISFTGSTQVGRNIGRIASGGEYLKHVALELGGNSPFVVLADADIEQAVNAAVVGKFLHQGQICMAINRIIVEQPLLETFTQRFVERVKALPYGDPSKAETVIGPVINSKQLAGLQRRSPPPRPKAPRCWLAGKPRATSCRLTCSARLLPTWRSPVKKSLALWSGFNPPAIPSMPWNWPIAANMDCRALCSPPAWSAACNSPNAFTPA